MGVRSDRALIGRSEDGETAESRIGYPAGDLQAPTGERPTSERTTVRTPSRLVHTPSLLLSAAALLFSGAWCPAQSPAAPPAEPRKPAPAAQSEGTKNAAVVPVPRKDEFWVKRSESFDKRAKEGAEKGDIGVIFMGDSITQGWEGNGAGIWKDKYAPRGAVNMGIGGDRTQHVLWRLEHGNIEGLAKPKSGAAPKLVVLMIGTNNSNGKDHSAEEIAEGIKAVVSRLRERLPESRVLLLGIFPRGEKPNAQREKNARAGELASSAADGKWVHYLDIGAAFLEPDGTLSKDVMPDHLHLSAEGYRRWAEAMEPKMKELLGEGE